MTLDPSRFIADNLIEPREVIRLIVDFIYPTLEDLKGEDCLIRINRIMPYEGRSIVLPFSVSENERSIFKKFLPYLPPLHGNMSHKEINEFLTAFIKKSTITEWTPGIIGPEERADRNKLREEIFEIHREELIQSILSGRLVVVNSELKKSKNLAPSVFIPEKAALKYLESIGIIEKRNHKLRLLDNSTIDSEQTTALALNRSANFISKPLNSSEIEKRKTNDKSDSEEAKNIPTSNEFQNEINSSQDDTKSFKVESELQIIKLKDVIRLTGLSKSKIYNMMNKERSDYDETFPLRIKIGKNSYSSGWILSDISNWIKSLQNIKQLV